MTVATDAWFTKYFTDNTYDEMFKPDLSVKGDWNTLLENFKQIGVEGLTQRQNDINWLLEENGVTYNVYNDPNGLNRPWNLNVVPFLLDIKEWQQIEKGLKQRADLLDKVLKDVYGERKLIKEGIVPHEVIYGHRGFLRQCDKINYKIDRHLLLYAADLARGSDGRMWVVNDRSQAPSGMGYALENRSTANRVFADVFADMNIKRLSEFFKEFNELLVEASPEKIENPNIVILTPGSHNETYFEHAYLASFLGYPLVQGNDLVVRDGHLYMKSLKGLKRVHVVLRRVDDVFTDPLELREDSHLGVAGLLDVVRRQNVAIVNPIGSGILENPGLIPFMPAICRFFLKEELHLPQIASWWCGQEKERKYVLENLSKLVIKPIDRTNREHIHFGELLSEKELEALRKEIEKKPYHFVAQEHISFSTTPNFSKGSFEPRNMVARTFTMAGKNGYNVMPGGLVRVASERDNLRVSNQRGGTSKDFWIIGNHKNEEQPSFNWNRKSAVSVSGLDDLPSLTAENLYWAGRYVGRTLVNARFLRMVLKQMNSTEASPQQAGAVKLDTLYKAVTQMSGTFPGFMEDSAKGKSALENPLEEILSVVLDRNRVGSLANTMSMFSNSYYSIRNLWSSDMWRVFENIQKIWRNLENEKDITITKLIRALNQLITRLIAFMGLIEESIMVDQGLLLYFIGLQLEQSMLTITKCRALLVIKQPGQTEYEVLESLLSSHESLNIYRYSYRSYIRIEPVISLLLMDLHYPRSLAFQLGRLQKDIGRLPHSIKSDVLMNYEKYVFEAFASLRLASSESLSKINSEDSLIREDLDSLLEKLSDLLFQTSQSISNTYFNHTYKQSQLVDQNFPL
ncbi:circularly permuted type 2 ATP-grasp protein [Leeuwenhoekiella sp. NPDC079379]|uniref:circularly permuted type 2 ATP-grasp protein n=1 Tax=Leeuwenhoekiella sp. NPDC079379 TaxID=3364122 RepID=UPI0037CA01AD